MQLRQNVLLHSRTFIQPAHDYLNRTIIEKLHAFLHLFEVAALVNPFYIRDVKPQRLVFQELIRSLNYFDADSAEAMYQEFDLYNALVATIPPDLFYSLPTALYDTRSDEMKEHCDNIMRETIVFWRKYKEKLPNLYTLFHYLITFPTSSAAVERLFSILQRSFSDKQTHSLEDYVSLLSLMYQYNKR